MQHLPHCMLHPLQSTAKESCWCQLMDHPLLDSGSYAAPWPLGFSCKVSVRAKDAARAWISPCASAKWFWARWHSTRPLHLRTPRGKGNPKQLAPGREAREARQAKALSMPGGTLVGESQCHTCASSSVSHSTRQDGPQNNDARTRGRTFTLDRL